MTGVVRGYSTGTDIELPLVLSSTERRTGQLLTVQLVRVLEEAFYRVDMKPASVAVSVSATHCESETIIGDCGGSAYAYVCLDDVNGFFDGYFIFYSYCSEGVTISGRVDFSGWFDVTTGFPLQLSLSFDNLTVLANGHSFILTGTIDYDFSTSPVGITADVLLSDNSTGKVYWMADYDMWVTEGADYAEVEISGRYYDPDYGYVDIYTEQPLRFYLDDAWPSQGVLVGEGEAGIEGGRTKARLTALSSTTYQVDADTDGDGEYDWNSGIMKWSDL